MNVCLLDDNSCLSLFYRKFQAYILGWNPFDGCFPAAFTLKFAPGNRAKIGQFHIEIL